MSDSIWKKEIRLRKPKPEAEKTVAQEKPATEKRAFGRKRDPLPPFPSQLLDNQRAGAERPHGTVVVPIVPGRAAYDPVQRLERWSARIPAPTAEPAFPRTPSVESEQPPSLLPERTPPEPVPHTTPVDESAPVEPDPEPEADTVVVELEPELAPAAEKVPLLKRELSFRRKPKAAKAPKVKRVNPAEAAVAAAVITAEKKPLLKRELSLKRKPKVTKAAKEPRVRRELHFPKLSLKLGAKRDHKVTRVVGLRIGSSQLAAAHIQNNGSAELVQLARSPLDRGLIVAGEVRDAPGLTKALKEFFAENKLPRKDVRLGIASNRIGVRVLDVPAVDDPKQFENAVRFRAQELLPIPVTDAILDHVLLDETRNDEGVVMRRVLLVFAHRDLVARFVDVCRGAGVRLSGIDLEAFALLRAVANPDDDGAKAVVAVAIGHERTVLAVSDGGVCDFTRVLEWGGSTLDVGVARALNLTPSQAEPVKQLLDLESDTAPEGLSPVQFEAVKSAAKTEIGVLGRELVSSLRFYQSRADSLAIGEVLLSGGTAHLAGLSQELSRLLGAPVRVADPFAHVTVGKKVELPTETGSLAIAVGLGIEA